MPDTHLTGPGQSSRVSIAANWVASRRRILLAAKQHFTKLGFHSGSYAEIAKLAGLTEAEARKHFPTKLDVLMAIYEEGWAAINPRVAEIMMTAASAREAAVSMVTVVLHMLERDPELVQLMVIEGYRVDPATGDIRLSRGYQRFGQMCQDLVVRGQKDGTFKLAIPPALIATVLVGAIESLLRGRLLAAQAGNESQFSTAHILATFDTLVSQYRP